MKKIIIITIIVVFVLCLIPIKRVHKDGGTISYNAILYSYTDYHQLQDDGTYYDAKEFRIFPFNYFN